MSRFSCMTFDYLSRTRKWGEPRRFRDSSGELFIMRTAGAVTLPRGDGTGLRENLCLYAVHRLSQASSVILVTREELCRIFNKEIVEEYFPDEQVGDS